MTSDDQMGLLDQKKGPGIVVTSLEAQSTAYDSRFRRNSAGVDEMTHINEAREEDFSDARRYGNPSPYHWSQPIPEHNFSQQPAEPSSMLRRLTTKLRSPISGSQSRSTKRSKGKQYANLHGDEADHVAVDLSSLEGLGFELQEVVNNNTANTSEQSGSYIRTNPADQEEHHSYSSAVDSLNKPDFTTWKKSLGSGMVIGAQLKRDPSKVIRRDPSLTDHNASAAAGRIGQSLAQERNIIVAVTEPVDISSLAGNELHLGKTFDSITTARQSMLAEEHQSYFFPDDPDVPNWRPFSMRKPYILLLIFLALALAASQEILCQRSLTDIGDPKKGGLLAFDKVADLSIWNFFAWKYLPTMVTIIYAVMYSITDFDVRRLEPYYQLSQRDGSRASASLNLDHLTMFQYFVPFNALRLRQWAVLVSTIANIVAATIAPALQNPSIIFIKNNNCKNTCLPNDTQCTTPPECPGDEHLFYVRVDTAWSRAVSAAYLLVALALVFLFFQLRRKTGLLSDPKGIAGIASMATKSHILQDFRGLDTATRGEIHKRLAHRRYVLYKSSVWQGEWIMASEPPKDSERRLRSPHPIMLRLVAGIPFVALLVVCLGAVPVISLTKARVIPNKAPWLPILAATSLKMLWSTFEADVRLIEPFYQLSLGNALPQNSLTLDYQSTPYGWLPVRAVLNKHYLVALVGICTVSLDVLSVTVSSFSVNSEVFLRRNPRGQNLSDEDQTYISFWTSEALSVLSLLFVILTTILVYARRRHPFMPREPSTIAAVLSFIYASKMLDDFIDTERMDSAAMERKLVALGKRYALGWFIGRDKKIHCAIDEEPMTSKYVHGKPYHEAVAGPVDERFYP